MKLAHKNFLYTAIITGILTFLVIGYFVFMLPSLYVDYMSNENYAAIAKQHNTYLKEHSYRNITVKNPGGMTIDLPFSEETFVVTGKNFQAKITPKTEDMKNLLGEIKGYIKNNAEAFSNGNMEKNQEFTKDLNIKLKKWETEFRKTSEWMELFPFEVKTKIEETDGNSYKNPTTKIHLVSDNTMIIEAGISDGENQFTNYLGLTYENDRMVLSYLPMMTPQMKEITPIVIHSLPMIIAMIILFALIVSNLYSHGIVDPITKLVKHTEGIKKNGLKTNGLIANMGLEVQGKDEISMLIQTLNELYEEINKNYKDLELKNKELEQKNKSQEVFLQSSSHQLKTPISAALLLVEGMMNQIGKYQDTAKYLPQVKQQLLSMKKMVEEILYLSRCEENLDIKKIDLQLFIQQKLIAYQIPLGEGNIQLQENYGEHSLVLSDENLLSTIMDNLISNAIVHSKEGAIIRISTKLNSFEIWNGEAHIEEKMMPNILEPFVTGGGKGHGLGLYIVNYYATILGLKLHLSNKDGGVLVSLEF